MPISLRRYLTAGFAFALLCGWMVSLTMVELPGPSAGRSAAVKQASFFDVDAELSILFVGDVHPGENYQEERETVGRSSILKEKGYGYSFELVKPFVRSADYCIANLETPLTDKRSGAGAKKEYIHWSDPVQTAGVLADVGVDAVCLANNHSLDQGHPGLVDTLDALERHRIAFFGAGIDESAAYKPLVIEKQLSNGEKLELFVLGAFAYNKTYDEEHRFYARDGKSGTACIDERLIKAARELRKARPGAIIVAFPHWGGNYRWRKNSQAKWARKLIDAGADLIIGHGAHRFQEIESYRGHWILYNMGNFVMNSGGRYKQKKSTSYSFTTRLELGVHEGRVVKTLKLHPIQSNNRKTRFRPRPLDRSEFDEFVSLLSRKSPSGVIDQFSRPAQDDLGRYIEFQF